ncbi:MAG TPA: TrkH family potassium uptake protein [Bacteroidales bacterium]|nr:TrkH family potassium uptake protein [Bacteroidales bacterium]
MNRELNIKLVLKVLGGLLLVEAIFLLTPIFIALIYAEYSDVRYYLIAMAVAIALGIAGLFAGKSAEEGVGKREGAIIVTTTWVIYTIIGALPFTLSGNIPDFTDAFFEILSGFTTTGTTILNNIEDMPNNVLFWRSMTHWMGGLGIIVIFLALLPMIGGTGYQLFMSETTTPAKEKIHPRISETAKIMLGVYVLLTVLCLVALVIAGMDTFDALNHALSTVSTGGFSTKQLSIAYFNSPAIEYVVIFFMFFSGVNFTLYYFLIELQVDKIKKNEELKYYVLILLGATLIILFSHIDFSKISNWREAEQSFRSSLFIATSCITSTGFATEDFTLWNSFTWVVMLVLMISGASAYSTSGGIKISRLVLLAKFCYYEFKKLIHPNAVMPVKFNGQVVRDDTMMRILAFSMIYIFIIVIGSFVLGLTGLGFEESLSGVITCMADVGLGLGDLGPSHSFSEIPVFSKWFLAFIMLVGRLEIYSVLLLFTPAFWKK